MTGSHDVELAACSPTPMAGYLAALGVLRIIGEQADQSARGWWTADAFILRSGLDVEGLISFFCDRYEPTPVIAPWNGGSGFREEKNPSAVEALTAIERSTTPRLHMYRTVIMAGRNLYRRYPVDESKRQKQRLIDACRAELADAAIPWIDAAVITMGDDDIRTPPLLGTGGNDGRLDFSTTFMSRIAEVLGIAAGRPISTATRDGWLRDALVGDGAERLCHDTTGYFDPGGAGGIRTGATLVNPWRWILMLEGALLFASGVARRLNSASRGGSRATAPFTVSASPVGYGTGSDEEARQARGEAWMPLWSRPAPAAEIRRLISEGRLDWDGEQARNGLDSVRAVTSLGVDRGVDAFVRYALLTRNGLSTLAVPIDRVEVTDRREVRVTAQADAWLQRIRRANTPAAARSALRRVDEALFSVARRGEEDGLAKVLIAMGVLERVVSQSTGLRRDGIPPITGLCAADWVPRLRDSREVRLAIAFASLRDRVSDAREHRALAAGSLRTLFRPIVHLSPSPRMRWSDAPSPVDGLGVDGIVDVLARALVRRGVERLRRQRDGDEDEAVVGVSLAFDGGLEADLDDVLALVDDDLDQERLGQLIEGLLVLDWSTLPSAVHPARSPSTAVALPAAALLLPFFCGCDRVVRMRGNEGTFEIRLLPQARWASLLAAGRVAEVAYEAVLRLRMARVDVIGQGADWRRYAVPLHDGTDTGLGRRLAAAALLRLHPAAIGELIQRCAPPPLSPTSTKEDAA